MTPSPEKFLRARITQRQDVSADLWAIGVDPGGEFRFNAGQYATLGVETPHKLIERPYSIVSSQYEREVEFFIELVPRGATSFGSMPTSGPCGGLTRLPIFQATRR
jgi:ferredoxin-NADP reductase